MAIAPTRDDAPHLCLSDRASPAPFTFANIVPYAIRSRMTSPTELSPGRRLAPELHIQLPSSSRAHADSDVLSEKVDSNFLAPEQAALSPSESREAASRLNDDLELLRAERLVSNEEENLRRSRSRESTNRAGRRMLSTLIPRLLRLPWDLDSRRRLS